MSDSHFIVPSAVPFPGPQSAILLGEGSSLPLRTQRPDEQIALGAVPVAEAPPLVREVIEGRPPPYVEATAIARLLNPQNLESDLDLVLAQLVQEVGASVHFDTTIPAAQAAANVRRRVVLIETLASARARMNAEPVLVLNT